LLLAADVDSTIINTATMIVGEDGCVTAVPGLVLPRIQIPADTVTVAAMNPSTSVKSMFSLVVDRSRRSKKDADVTKEESEWIRLD
jgi:hypothetical protein